MRTPLRQPGVSPVRILDADLELLIAELEGPTTRIYNYVLGDFAEKKIKKKKTFTTDGSSGPIFFKKEEEDTSIQKSAHKKMFIVVLSIIANTQNQARCLSIDEWINKLGCIHRTECYLAIKRNELSSHKKARRKVKCMFPRKGSQSKKTVLYDSNNMTFRKRQNCREIKKFRG